MTVVYDKEMDDEEWRDVNFSDTQIQAAMANNTKQPTADELIKYAQKYGPDGVLESAILLQQFDYQKVARALTKMKGKK